MATTVVQTQTVRISLLTDRLVRIEQSPTGRFVDAPTQVVLDRDLGAVQADVVRDGAGHRVITSGLEVRYDGGPLRASGLRVQALGGVSNYHSSWRYGEVPPTLGGTVRTLDMVDGAVELEPGLIDRHGVTLLDDSQSLIRGADGWQQRESGAIDLYLFVYGRDYRAALRDWYRLAGPQPLVPRSVLGTWWSRYHRYSADEYLALVDRFAANDIPLSVAVLDMDWHLVDIDPALGSGWTGYTWDPALFGDHRAFLAALHERGLVVTVNDHPADGVRAHEWCYSAMANALGIDPASGRSVEFDIGQREFVDAMFEHVWGPMQDEGIDFWWIDWQQGSHSSVPGLDPLWALNEEHTTRMAARGLRPVILSRYAGPGSHRFPVGFSGDTVISWASLDFQPRFTATAANIGYGWWSHDIGGHMFGVKDDELATRWLQFGVLSPITRLHSTSDEFNSKEPWRFGDEAQAVMADWLRLRHRLVPYLYTAAAQGIAQGRTLIEPLYHAWPEQESAYRHGNEFLLGPELVVAPITTPRDPSSRHGRVQAWLPPGDWVDLLTGGWYAGDRELALHRPLATMPLLARSGAVIPLHGRAGAEAKVANPDVIEWLVVGDAAGEGLLIEDDGAPESLMRVAETRARIDWEAAQFTIRAVQGAASVLPDGRRHIVRFLGTQPLAASIDGRPCDPGPDRSADLLRHGWSIDCGVVDAGRDLVVRLEGAAQRAIPDPVAQTFDYLDQAQCAFGVKREIDDLVRSGRPVATIVAALAESDHPREVVGPVIEILTAAASFDTTPGSSR